MKRIPLTQGKHALVDDEDYERLAQYKWCYGRKDGYARRNEHPKGGGSPKAILMHREIMNPPLGMEVDHRKSGRRLDNRKQNLRIVTHMQNGWNRGKPSNNTTGFKGVSPSRGKFLAKIVADKKQIFLGRFDTAIEADAAYKKAAESLHAGFTQYADAA